MQAADTIDRYLERGRLAMVLATLAINVPAVSLLVFIAWYDWRTGAALDLIDNCLLIGFSVLPRDELFA